MVELLDKKYKKLMKIGKGGMAEIFLVQDRTTKEKYAIKILHPDRKDSYADKKRFLEEINLTKKVQSPYVVKIIDWEWNDDIQYIVMEYIQGETLKEYIYSKTKLTVDEAVDFTKQIALGFNSIHKSGIVHRDLKSTNIIVSDHGQIKIIDFGIALTKESDRLTKTDNIIASPQYIAPELVSLEEPTKKSDIYSLGILMYEMLIGSLPFNGKNAVETIIMHRDKEVPHVNKILSTIPQSLTNVIIKATAKKPDSRHSTMYELYKDVDSSLSLERIYEPLLVLDSKQSKKTLLEIINSKWILFILFGILIIILISIIVVLAMGVS